MEDIIAGFIFLGTLGFVVIVLIITYCCVKHKMCCCQKSKDKTENGEDKASEALLAMGESGDEFQPLPYEKVPTTVNGSYDDYSYMRNYTSSDPYTSEDDLLSGEERDVLGELPASYMSVKTGAYSISSISTDSQFDSLEISGTRKMKKDTYVDGCKLKLSLMYSKTDMFLMLTIMEVTGMPTKALGGYKFIRVAIALLPEKKYHSKTKVQQVMGDDVITFGDSFKFSSVTRESLFTSAFRFRLYARNKRTREVCTGEIFMQLADVAQRSFGFVATKPFERKRKR